MFQTWTREFRALGCFELPFYASSIAALWPHPLSIVKGEHTTPPPWNTFLPACVVTASTDGLLQSWLLPPMGDFTPENQAPTKLSARQLPRFRVPTLHRDPHYIYEVGDGTDDILAVACAPSGSRIYKIRTEQNYTPVSHLPDRVKSLEVVSVTAEYLSGHFGLELGNSEDVEIALTVCQGHQNSVHMCLAYSGTPFCCAVSKQVIRQALWEWRYDRLFVLHEDGSLVAFSTRCSPCQSLITVASDVRLFSSPSGGLSPTSSGLPIILLHATSGKKSRVSGSSLVVCRTDGSLVHICTEGGGVLTVSVGQADTSLQETRQSDLEYTDVNADRQIAPNSTVCLGKFFEKEEYLSADTTGAIRFWVASQDAHVKPIVDVTSVRLRAPDSDTGGAQILFSTIAPDDVEGPVRIWTPEFHEYV
ncbi:hypothetical protein SprV_0501841400 [Sparganum proliferum]